MYNILVIDDDKDICILLERFLSKNGYSVECVHSGKMALQSIARRAPSLILCDFRLEDMSGADLLEKVKEIYGLIPFIIITGYSDVRVAVHIMKSGAVDYVVKPLLPDEILLSIKRALKSPSGNFDFPEKRIRPSGANDHQNDNVVGNSPAIRKVVEQVKLVAPINYSVVIYGESGSGKEAIANEIHRLSPRAEKPFVAIDCGALSKELAGSELFGHEKGAFTGAMNQKIGSFERANGGTIFLDEIANLTYDIQVALLRLVQERKLRRVGGDKEIDLDVRIIVASNERLSELTRKGKFREDLYHRFNEFSIDLPPLRDRGEDIMLYASFFLERTCAELNKTILEFSEEVIHVFMTYPWPGNLRELHNVIKRAALLTSGDAIEVEALPIEITYFDKSEFTKELQLNESDSKSVFMSEVDIRHASIDAEFEVIMTALKKCNYNKSKAATMLNIDRKTLYNKMKRYREFNGGL